MALFRRRRSASSDPAVAIEEFWSAWPELRDGLATALDAGESVPDELARSVTERVRRIHAKLAWDVSRSSGAEELGGLDLDQIGEFSAEALADLARMDGMEDPAPQEPGPGATPAGGKRRYSLTLSGGTDDTVRVLAERWRQSAPPEPEWDFFPARQPDHDALSKPSTWDDHELDLGHASVALRVNQTALKIEVSVYHPDFMFLPTGTRQAVAEHITLLALGEDDMVRWIGSVTPLTEKPLDPLPPTSMPSVVRQLTEAFGGGSWVTAQWRIPIGGTAEISLRHPLSRRDFPAFTLYLQVNVPYSESGPDRLPTGNSARALSEFSSGLREILGSNGALLGHRTVAGQRQFHFYVDPESGILPRVERAVHDWPEGRATLSSFLDPQWEAIEQFAKPLRRRLER